MKIEQITTISEEIVAAFERLMPQLTSYTAPPGRETLEQIIAAPCTFLFMARLPEDEAIIGLLALAVFRTPTGVHAWIEDVVVDEAQRGKGAGEALTRAAIDHAARMDAKSVNLTSRPARAAANRLYQRIGFQPWETNLYRYPLK